MSDNSSSSEDEFDKIKEAVDENFLTEDLYSNDKLKSKPDSQLLPQPSLRGQNHKTVSINPFSIKVTPEFQLHVSKHLSRLLDELIDDTEVILKKKKKLKLSCQKSGVKLLCSSKDYLESCSNDKVQANPKFAKTDNIDVNIYTERAKAVAVSPEWVLSQEETKHWAVSTKGQIEVIKLDGCSKKKNKKRKKKLNHS